MLKLLYVILYHSKKHTINNTSVKFHHDGPFLRTSSKFKNLLILLIHKYMKWSVTIGNYVPAQYNPFKTNCLKLYI